MIATTFGRDIYETRTVSVDNADDLIAAAKASDYEVNVSVPEADFESLCDQLRAVCDSNHAGGDVLMPAFQSFQGEDWRVVVTRNDD